MIKTFEKHQPRIAPNVFVAPDATVLGQVDIAAGASVWYGAVLRGDIGSIRVGERTNLQDQVVVHVTGGKHDTLLENDITVGHRAVLHGCSIAHHVLVGIGAIVLDGVRVEPYCLIGAGSMVPPGKHYASGNLILGSPARIVRPLTDNERAHIDQSVANYVELAQRHYKCLSQGSKAH